MHKMHRELSNPEVWLPVGRKVFRFLEHPFRTLGPLPTFALATLAVLTLLLLLLTR